MNKKTLLILLGVFIALAFVASFSWWGEYLNLGKKSSLGDEINFSNFDEGSVDRISIIKEGEEDKIISKENDVWMINGLNADKEEIDDFFKTLLSLRMGQVVSKNPENHGNFNVKEESGYILTLTSYGADSMFIIGKQGATPDSFYTKTKTGDNVYEVSGALRDKLSQDIATWRDKITEDALNAE